MINQRDPLERYSYDEFIFRPMQGADAQYIPLRFSEEENNRMCNGSGIYFIQNDLVVSCTEDRGRIYVYVGPRSVQNHNPNYWEFVEKYFWGCLCPGLGKGKGALAS